MQLIAKDGLLLRRDFAELGAIGFPVSGGAGDQVELHDRYGQTVNDTVAILGQVHHLQHGLANQVDGKHQVAATAGEPASLRDMREQIAMLLPIADQLRFLIPAAAFTHQGQGDQLAIATFGLRPWSLEQRCDLLPNIIHNRIHPSAEISEIGYHRDVLQ